jgi:hypothetical protein
LVFFMFDLICAFFVCCRYREKQRKEAFELHTVNLIFKLLSIGFFNYQFWWFLWVSQTRGLKKHLKRLNAPKRWMLDKLVGALVKRAAQCIHRKYIGKVVI